MKLFAPFEQFEINIFKDLDLGIIDISITNLTITLLVTSLYIVGLLYLVSCNINVIPNRWQSLVELIYKFVADLISEQTGKKGLRNFPILFVLFLMLLLLNLGGLIPYGFTVTAQIVVTFLLAFSFFLSIMLIGFKEHGISYLKIFVPSGIPNWLLPLLVFIEIMSYCLRPLSLSIRLFANMLAGHILLYIISVATIFALNKFILLGLIPWIFITAFMVLEIGIAFLQAYVFCILICIYLYDSYYSGH